MIIQWYPGHMNKALKAMADDIEKVDCILYVLDSRAPFSCLNPKLSQVIGSKPIIYVLSKADMADSAKLDEWRKYFSRDNYCVTINSTASGSSKIIMTVVRQLLAKKIEKYAKKNIKVTLRFMVVGVPNCGKSTLINNLCGKARAITGNIAGVTRGKQWVRIESGVEVMDTPGTLWPAFNNNLVAHHLAYIGSIRDEVLDIPSLSLDFIEELDKISPDILRDRYGCDIEKSTTTLEKLEKICLSRGHKLRGGELDYDKGAASLITDFRKGYLGKITLETVHDIPKLKKVDRIEKQKK